MNIWGLSARLSSAGDYSISWGGAAVASARRDDFLFGCGTFVVAEGGDGDSSGYDDARGGADCYADIDSPPRRRGRARIGNFRAGLGERREGGGKIISGA
jgi:hypothetical protein